MIITGKSHGETSHIESSGTFATYSFHSSSREHLDKCPRSSFITDQIQLLHGEHERLHCCIFSDGVISLLIKLHLETPN